MALMLLPYWTDGCIGSMEGLYFEASATTPFHFLTQAELSTAPSAAQRDLPYGSFDITKGIDHLQMMGVKYYMATSANAIARRADSNPELTEVADVGAVGRSSRSPTASWWRRSRTSPPWSRASTTARSSGWRSRFDELRPVRRPGGQLVQRPGAVGRPPARTAARTTGSGSRSARPPTPSPLDRRRGVRTSTTGEESISFDVDEVGVPVLVKTSYFPNWQVSGRRRPVPGGAQPHGGGAHRATTSS